MAIVDTCNEALSAIAADTIQSIDEGSLAARECKRHYPGALQDLLALHDWGAAIRRVALAEIANDRPGEWGFAYALPGDCGNLRRVLPAEAMPGWPARGWWHGPVAAPLPFVADAGTIYTDLGGALLDYTVATLAESDMRPLFRRALIMTLASRIAMPIRKDRAIRADALQLADNAARVAMADDLNRYPRVEPDYPSDVERVRNGGPGPGWRA